MHDLLEQMGKEIVIEESNNTLGEQSRLWKSKDIIHILRNDLGTGKVEAISLKFGFDEKVEISTTAFKQMHNLKFLRMCSNSDYHWKILEKEVLLPNGLEFLPENLQYLWWDKYPLSYLPPNFCPENLVQLWMPYSQLKELSNVEKSLKSLKLFNLKYSKHLMKIPDFSKCPNLEHLQLKGCSSLVEISWSSKAQSWSPILDLRGCTSLCCLLEIPYNIEVLHLEGTSIKQLPPNIGCVKYLRCLDVSDCVNLQQLPENLGNFKQLEDLNCSGCKGLKLPPLNGLINLVVIDLSNCHMSEFPNGLCSLTSLKEIYLSGNNFKSIPTSINELSRLEELYLRDCNELECIPELPSTLWNLNAANCTSLESVSTAILPQRLVLRDCINLKEQESWSTIVNDELEQHLSGNKLHEDYYWKLSIARCEVPQNMKYKIKNNNISSLAIDQLRVYSSCVLCIAGSEVPQGMKYKINNGSSLSVTLDFHDLIGFSLCVVVPPKYSFTSIHCCVSVLPENDFYLCAFENPEIQESQSENMFLWYSSYKELYSTENEIKVSFKLATLSDDPIVKCGFSPVYKNEQRSIQILEEGQGSNLKSGKRNDQDNVGS